MNKPVVFSGLVDLASEDFSTKVLYANDDFFAEKENLIKTSEPVFIPEKYTENGKWMDGWESRRKRESGYDFCIIKLGVPGIIRAINIDTSHFLGNAPEFASLEVLHLENTSESENLNYLIDQNWRTVLAHQTIQSGSHNYFVLNKQIVVTHVKLNIFPDGGVARLRLYGDISPESNSNEEIDLIGLTNGGKALLASDTFFSPMNNINKPSKMKNMGDGWETKRSRRDGFDWIIIQLGSSGIANKLELDTFFFKGNYPDKFSLEGCFYPYISPLEITEQDIEWEPLIPITKLNANSTIIVDMTVSQIVSHVRLKIFPDGGVARLRLRGKTELKIINEKSLEKLTVGNPEILQEQLLDCSGSSIWVKKMIELFPFDNLNHFFVSSRQIWRNLADDDKLEGFSAHPRIGNMEEMREKFNNKNLSKEEQEGIKGASDTTLEELKERNDQYFDLFGFIFIVFATGKSAPDIVKILRTRLENPKEKELRIASEEHLKITQFRMLKLLSLHSQIP